MNIKSVYCDEVICVDTINVVKYNEEPNKLSFEKNYFSVNNEKAGYNCKIPYDLTTGFITYNSKLNTIKISNKHHFVIDETIKFDKTTLNGIKVNPLKLTISMNFTQRNGANYLIYIDIRSGKIEFS